MKKFLSLVLTLALTLSLVVLPANAGESGPSLTIGADIEEVVATGEVKLTATLTNKPSGTITYKWSYQTGSAGKKDIKTIKNSSDTATYTWTVPKTAGTYTVMCEAMQGTTSLAQDSKEITVVANNFEMYVASISSSEKTLKGDETFNLSGKVYLRDKSTKLKVASGVTYTYKSSDKDIIDVDENGVVSAKSEGSASVTVTATYLGKTYTSKAVSFTAETLSVSAGSVVNGSYGTISVSDLMKDIASKVKNFYGTDVYSKKTKVTAISINTGTVNNGKFYTDKKCTEAYDGTAVDKGTLYFEAEAGFLGKTVFTARATMDDDGTENDETVTVTIDITSKGEIKDTVYATKADSDVDFKVKYTELYVYDGSDSFKTDMYEDYATSDWDKYEKNDKVTVEEDEFSNGKCVKYVVALDSKDVASTGTITVYQKAYEIKYSGVAGETVTFEHDDFVSLMKEIAYDEDVITSKTSTKITLNDVDFDLPSSSDGVLYYNGAKMTSSTTCKDMDKVTFAIGKNVKDTVSIDFTINATDSDKDKHEFDGTVVVSVVHEDIKYTNAAGAVVTFKASDFEDFFTDEYSKGELDYVKFDKLPTTLEGVLYASYNTLYTGALAKTSDKFYYDADSKTDYEIGDVVFKGANLTATSTKVYIPFTAYGEDKNDDDVEVSGWVVITVAPQRVMNFTDVKIGEWYYNNIKSAYNMGLIDGKTATTFNPNDNMTYAEAVKLAACMHQLKKDGAVTLTNSKTGNWYDSYVDYAIKNGIIVSAPTAAKANTAVTRREYVDVFYNALPATDYVVRNSITKIPDLANDSTNAKIYTFYKAGILTGYANTPGKTTGSFGANDNIKRSEVATILIRMMDSSTRMYFTL